ncbi:MAG: indole-3-glycerol phosphate synthase TrpC [Tannerella sp.]|jgi:indole-3-glycerol phosphate synthase|nr:indole-3-glycerol phosphate synthase TrpC [Tannerella sp.]
MDILDKIIANKRLEVARQKAAVPLVQMLHSEEWRLHAPTVSMRKALESSASGIISEFKRRSPSKGWLHPQATIDDIVPGYEKGGASACSILTDSDFFGGSFGDLKRARSLTKLPLLRKDFIIDEYQLYQARVLGADAVLLIAASLTKEECESFAGIAHQLELEVLLEIHNEKEFAYFTENIDMLGVNNRNLGTFHTDVENSFRMIERMKAETGEGRKAPVFVSESGISDTKIIKSLRDAGYRGFLIGETFMKTADPGATVAEFVRELRHG